LSVECSLPRYAAEAGSQFVTDFAGWLCTERDGQPGPIVKRAINTPHHNPLPL